MIRKGRSYRFRLDAQEIRRYAHEIERQVDFYERNGAGDELRFALIESEALWLLKTARRAVKRHAS